MKGTQECDQEDKLYITSAELSPWHPHSQNMSSFELLRFVDIDASFASAHERGRAIQSRIATIHQIIARWTKDHPQEMTTSISCSIEDRLANANAAVGDLDAMGKGDTAKPAGYLQMAEGTLEITEGDALLRNTTASRDYKVKAESLRRTIGQLRSIIRPDTASGDQSWEAVVAMCSKPPPCTPCIVNGQICDRNGNYIGNTCTLCILKPTECQVGSEYQAAVDGVGPSTSAPPQFTWMSENFDAEGARTGRQEALEIGSSMDEHWGSQLQVSRSAMEDSEGLGVRMGSQTDLAGDAGSGKLQDVDELVGWVCWRL